MDMHDAYGDGFAEHTTPDFEEVEMPPLAVDDVYEVGDGVGPFSAHPAATGGRYPLSPRATKSPSPKGMTSTSLTVPGASGGSGMQGSPIVKVEQFTPTHSVNGGNGMGINMHPTPLSFNSGGTSTSSDQPAEGITGMESLTVKRGEDGAWSGGINPTMRSVLGNSGELPFNLKEQSIQQALDVKKAEIEDWLKRNTDASKKEGKHSRGRSVSSVGRVGGLKVKTPKRGRAKSFSDLRVKGDSSSMDLAPAMAAVTPGESSVGNRTGVLMIDDDDIDSSDEDSSVASSFNEGSLDNVLGDDESMNTSEAPPTEGELKKSELEEEEEQRRLENDPAYFPKPRQFYSAHPWHDTVGPVMRGARIAMKNQPHTANAAIMKFQAYAENIETASRVATFGSQASRSRRLSAGDADKTLVESGLLKRLSFGRDKDKEKESTHQRRPSIWGNMVKNSLKRGFSNAGDKGKEKESENDNEKSSLGDSDTPTRRRGDSTASSLASATSFGPPKPSKSWTKVSLKVDTTVTSVPSAFAQMAGIGAGIGQSSAHITSKPTSPSPPEKRPTGLGMGAGVMQALRRPRSKSELITGPRLQKNSKPAFGIVGLLGQYGGPPAVPIKSPVGSGSSAGSKLKPSFTFGEESRQRGIADVKQNLLSPPDPHRHDGYDDDDDDMDDHENEAILAATSGGVTPGTKLPKLNITPNAEGFAGHVRERTPGLPPKLVDRIVHEQGKRYKKLVDHRQKHLAATKNSGRCGNGAKCRGSVGAIGAGGQEEGNGHKRGISTGSYEGESEFLTYSRFRFSDIAQAGLILIEPLAYSSDETAGDHSPTEGKVAATQFPPGVPQPPVSRLPAEFECPICFKVKKFTKPSDWTKHVHEDVHPFTCTFPECTEPKSFKRKADWVRHENERHRHLEWWTCNIPDCTHTCFRKDNFVQHLVREHKMAEPKLKAQKAAAKAAGKAGPGGKKGKNKAVAGVDGAPTQEDFDKVWQIVDDCHKITNKLPSEEKCRFCGNVCPTWKKLTVHLARHMETISLPVLDLITDDSVVPTSMKSPSNKASRSGVAPVAPMPKVQPVQLPTDMDIDFSGGMPQQQQSADGEYEEEIFPQYTSSNANYNVHPMQQTSSRNSPHLPLEHQFGVQPPSRISQYAAGNNSMVPGNVGYSPEQNIRNVHNVHPGLHSALNQSFEYPGGHELYPSPASATQPRATSVNGGYSPSPTYSHHQLQHSPSQRITAGLPGQQHLHVQQPQPSYYAYGQASGQVRGNIGVGVGQVHNQVAATAHGLTHGLIENNNGQFPLYAGGTEIPMAMMEVVEMAPMDPTENQFMRYLSR